MGKRIPDIIKQASRELRKNMTESEKLLWDKVRNEKIGLKINRQAPIYVFTEDSGLDRYIIADFYCAEKKLIIEIDGSIHDRKDVYFLDKEKEQLLIQSGYFVLRFMNDDIYNDISGVLSKIQSYGS